MNANEQKFNVSENDQKFLDSFLRAENRLAVLEQAFESARNGIVITDPLLPDNPIVYVNRAFLDLTGYELKEIIGKNCRFLQNEDRTQPNLEGLRNAIKTGQSYIAVLRNYKKDGTLFWNELSLSPVRDSDGCLVKFIGIQNDITAAKELEKLTSEFYSNVSHELRTPLTSVKGIFSLLAGGRAGELSNRAKELVKIGLFESDRLIRLINDILDIKKIEAGKFKLDLKNLEPQELIEQTIPAVLGFASQFNVEIITAIEDNKTITGDQDRLTQVLINLISNAIKFSDEGDIITVSCKGHGNFVRFSICDNGPGIDARNISKLFRVFEQVNSNRQPKGGTGLGLALCKVLVEQHGGTIGVDSKKGKGSTFWFEIPCA